MYETIAVHIWRHPWALVLELAFFCYTFLALYACILTTAARQQLERLPRRQQQPIVSSSPNATGVNNNNNAVGTTQANQNHTIITLNAGGRDAQIAASSSLPMVSTGVGVCNILGSAVGGGGSGGPGSSSQQQSQFLMARFMVPTMDEAEQAQQERARADRSQFVQALMLSTIANIQPFNKPANDEELSEEMSALNLGVGNTSSTVNSSVKRPTASTDDGGEVGGEQDGSGGGGGGATHSNYGGGGKEDENCDSLKRGGADSANEDESPNMHPTAQVPLVRGQHAASGKSKGSSAKAVGLGAAVGGGGGGGAVDRRSSRQTPPSSGGNAAGKSRELKQANSSSNTSTPVSSRQQHHVPDSR